MEARDTSTLTDEYSALPDDLLEIITISDDGGRHLRNLGRQQFGSIVEEGRIPDVPFFTVEDYQLRVWPAPTAERPLDVTLLYYERIAGLVGASDTNWLLTEEPDLYLYGALMHARVWLQDDERIALIRPAYEQMLAEVERRRVVATGVTTAVGTDIPITCGHGYDIARG